MRVLRGTRAGAATLWSVLFASAVAGDDISVSGNVILDTTAASPNYGIITLNPDCVLTVSRTVTDVQLNCRGVIRENGSQWIAGTEADPYPATNTFTVNLTGDRSLESAGNLSTPSTATPTYNRAIMGMPGSIRRWVAEVPTRNIVKLSNTVAVGATSLPVEQPMTLKAGTVIGLTTSMYNSENPSLNLAKYEQFATSNYGSEKLIVSSDITNSYTIPVTRDPAFAGTGTRFRHHGKLQYIVPNLYEDIAGTNLSYTARTLASGDGFGTVNGSTIFGSRVLAAIAGQAAGGVAAGKQGILDNRSTVGVLSYPIRITNPLDSSWNQHGYGASDMTMGLTSVDQQQGVWRVRGGKAGQLGAYPGHDHMRCITPYGQAGSGTFLGNLNSANNYIKKCSITDSTNRGWSIHGTLGQTMYQNVFWNVDTHCIFLEDGGEQYNVIDGNLVCGVNRINTVGRAAAAAASVSYTTKNVIKPFDTIFDSYFYDGGTTSTLPRDNINGNTDLNQQGPSGIWFSSPNNYLRNNIVVGAYTGIWNNFQKKPFGQSTDAVHNGFNTTPLQHDNNEVACCVYKLMSTLPRVGNEAGDLYGFFHPDGGFGYYGDDGTIGNGADATIAQRDLFQRFNGWKSDGAWYGNEAWKPLYDGWSLSGLVGQRNTFHNEHLGFFGNGSPYIRNSFLVTNTLDDAYPDADHTQFLSYGAGSIAENNIFIPSEQTSFHISSDEHSQEGGVMSLWDFYLQAVYPYKRNFAGLMSNSVILGKSPGRLGVFLPPPHMYPTLGSAYTAIYNPTIDTTGTGHSDTVLGRMGAVRLPADGSLYERNGGWLVIDSPFLLDGTTGSVYADSNTAGPNMSGKLLSSAYNYYGIQVQRGSVNNLHVLGLDGGTYAPAINYTLMASDGVTPISGGTWNTPMWTDGQSWPNMRHAPVRHGRFVDISWPIKTLPKGQPLPTALVILLHAFTADDGAPSDAHFFFSVDFNTSTTITSASLYTYGAGYVDLTTGGRLVGSRAALLASTTTAWYKDTATNKVWVHAVTQSDFHPDVQFRINDTN